MRMQGKSYQEIHKGLGIAKSTLSAWFRHLKIPPEAQEKIRNRSRAASLTALLKINRARTKKAEEQTVRVRSTSQKEIKKLSPREILLIGTTLYWSEGHKRPIVHRGQARTYHPVTLTSADPKKIGLFVRFLRESCKVTEDRITAEISLFDHQQKAYVLDFWHKITKLPFSNFRKVYQSKKSLPYGTIQIRVNDTALFHRIMGWIEGLQNF